MIHMCFVMRITGAFTSPLSFIRARPVSTIYIFTVLNCAPHRLNNYIDAKAICHLKIDLYSDFAAIVYLSVAPSPPIGFCLGWCSNLVGSKSGQIQSVKLLQNKVSNTTQQHSPPPIQTLSAFTILLHREGGR